MKLHESKILLRDCEAIEIPNGTTQILPAGTPVRITQALGDAFTVATPHGTLLRIAGQDADALGFAGAAVPEPVAGPAPSPADIERCVWDQLRTCFDPEIPVNIVDLGLVYRCQLSPLPGGAYKAEVQITLTAPGCGMGAMLAADAERKILKVPGVTAVDVAVVFDPPWNPSMMSAAAKLELGMV
jgi:probable FeS assembly SUF system protein SufT